jgi:hypothetical protein
MDVFLLLLLIQFKFYLSHAPNTTSEILLTSSIPTMQSSNKKIKAQEKENTQE